MPNLNKLEIIGNVGQESELRFTPSGKPVTNFSVAVNRNYTTADGEKKQETDWFNVNVWGKLAETCNQFVTKGQLVYVSGRVSLHTWEKQDGGTSSRLDVTANFVLFLNRKDGHKVEVEEEDVPF